MRNVVLGANGRIGRVLQAAWPVLAPDLAARTVWTARNWGASGGVSPDGAVRGDHAPYGGGSVQIDMLGDPAGLARAVSGAGTILCLAGVVPAAARSEAEYDATVALGLAAVRAAADSGARLLLASSAAVYGSGAGLRAETDTPAPVNPYGRAKAAMETDALALAAERGVDLCCLRIGNIAGLDAALGGWAPGCAMDCFPDGRTPARSYVGPLTLARVLADLTVAPQLLPEVLNVAAPDPVGAPVEMGALLDAADCPWMPRPAPDTAIPVVGLDLTLLLAPATGVTPVPGSAGARALAADWRAARAMGAVA
ncbi:NAD-dependent epimerase/dehydratase family protein [Chachezhania sediminis]|uniref:NAD-dependent epimerase/dehydratase family protein n=1 Tax=Chachezhania sediminis TaxID=2599291 RepID=UPI00131DBDDF|nr:NAD-dependent epimerase/dehydratase family protein [Chachezhania sediminis]